MSDEPSVIVFDKDGTLIDVFETWGPLFARIIPVVAGDQAEAVAHRLGVGLTDGSLTAGSPVIAESDYELAEKIAAVLSRPIDGVLATIQAMIDELGAEHAIPLPATDPVLKQLVAGGAWLGVATNDGEVSTERQLVRLGWREHFASVIGYDSGFGTKPDPGMLHESARRAGVATVDIVFVGDSDSDQRTAAAAGCRFVRVGPDVSLDTLLANG